MDGPSNRVVDISKDRLIIKCPQYEEELVTPEPLTKKFRDFWSGF